ncbi:MAG: DUF4345 domain-containing protein [Saprospiraceae bacterium]|nr:DUF4345 domain-containing protein [Saprospiraceae bacterium]
MAYNYLPKSIFTQRNFHLLTAIGVVFPVALCYGLAPETLLSKITDLDIFTIDLNNIFRGIMGLYLGIVIFWLMGVFFQSYWLAASWCLVFFMGGLASGRLFSMIVDGIPSLTFCIGLGIEIALASWSWFNINSYHSINKP